MKAAEVEDLPTGKVIGKRFKIMKKLGEGGCGSVYKVQDLDKDNLYILQMMEKKNHVAKLISSGKKPTFTYMIMTLLGESLQSLVRKFGPIINVSTQVRIGISVMFGLKQLHDIGYIHRDLKPANVALGFKGTPEERYFLILDFGLARQFVVIEANGKPLMRRPRERAMFRGTTRYCSIAMHDRSDQGRVDDLWALVYMLAEFRRPLPWSDISNKERVSDMKKQTPDEILLSKSPQEMLEFIAYLRTINYYDRPDYQRIYKIFRRIMLEGNYKWSDPYHWEAQQERSKTSKEMTKKKATAVCQSPEEKPPTSKKGGEDEPDSYFVLADFDGNPLGF